MQYSIITAIICSCLLVLSNSFKLDPTDDTFSLSDGSEPQKSESFNLDNTLSEDLPLCLENNVAGYCVMYYSCKQEARRKRSVYDSTPIFCNHYLEVCCSVNNILKEKDRIEEENADANTTEDIL